MKPLIPPVGRPISMRGSDPAGAAEALRWPGYQTRFFASGTASLAAAIDIARRRCGDIKAAEVILPAYGCPDLVAAALYAGVEPVLVDTGTEFHGYDLDRLAAAIGPSTVAVVAVNLLGVHEQRAAIRALLVDAGSTALLIEDDAQWLPEPVGAKESAIGDCVVISFGRGKPLSLLGGGALLVQDSLESTPAPLATTAPAGFALRARTTIYNLLLHPLGYGLVSRLPGLNIGATVFHPLDEIAGMDVTRCSWLPHNLEGYLQSSRDNEDIIGNLIAERGDLLNLAQHAPAGHGRLLRYPLLAGSAQERDRLVARINRAGWGATGMYLRPLREIDGIDSRVRVHADCPNAANFAGRLLTLPLQWTFSAAQLERLRAALD